MLVETIHRFFLTYGMLLLLTESQNLLKITALVSTKRTEIWVRRSRPQPPQLHHQ
jgi:hypothetical protein